MITGTFQTGLRKQRSLAILLVACGHTLLVSGCQSPWRFWRKDEPTLQQLLAAPQPWDAELPNRNAIKASGSDARGAAANRAANMANSADPQAAAQRTDGQPTEEEMQAAVAAAPPHLRPMMQRQVDAWKALSKSKQNDREYRDEEDSDETRTASAPPRRADRSTSHSSSGATVYRLSDNDEVLEPSEEPVDQPPSVQRSSRPVRNKSDGQADTQPQNGKLPGGRKLQQMQLASEPVNDEDDAARSNDEPASFSMRDDDDDAHGEPNDGRRVQEIAPPHGKRSSQPVPHTQLVDTGAPDNLSNAVASRNQRDKSQVMPASATGSRESRDNAVAPAVASSRRGEVGSTPDSSSSSRANSNIESPSNAKNYRDSLREALRLLKAEQEAATSSAPNTQMHLQASERMLHLLLGELEPALKPIEGRQLHEQECFRHQFQALYNAMDPTGNPVTSRRWSLVMDSQRQATMHGAALSNLELKSVAFCTNVEGYGAITKFPTNQFKADEPVLLYCEVDNFVSEQTKEGFETKLQGSYEIVDQTGHRIADLLLPQEDDICKRPRRDYFFVYRIFMPKTIAPGAYQLRLTIEDMKGKKYGQSSLDFQIVP